MTQIIIIILGIARNDRRVDCLIKVRALGIASKKSESSIEKNKSKRSFGLNRIAKLVQSND
jgi:hypothetical protein